VESTAQSRSQETLSRLLLSRPYDAGEEQMLARPQRKMTVALVALLIGLALVSVTAAVNRLSPGGAAGTLVWVVAMAAAIPLALAAFNAVCDHCLRRAAVERQTESLLDSYWPTVQRDLANQFHLVGRGRANGAARTNGHLSNGAPLAPPATPIHPLHRSTIQRSKHKRWVGQ
jgi:hypothetical protein